MSSRRSSKVYSSSEGLLHELWLANQVKLQLQNDYVSGPASASGVRSNWKDANSEKDKMREKDEFRTVQQTERWIDEIGDDDVFTIDITDSLDSDLVCIESSTSCPSCAQRLAAWSSTATQHQCLKVTQPAPNGNSTISGATALPPSATRVCRTCQQLSNRSKPGRHRSSSVCRVDIAKFFDNQNLFVPTNPGTKGDISLQKHGCEADQKGQQRLQKHHQTDVEVQRTQTKKQGYFSRHRRCCLWTAAGLALLGIAVIIIASVLYKVLPQLSSSSCDNPDGCFSFGSSSSSSELVNKRPDDRQESIIVEALATTTETHIEFKDCSLEQKLAHRCYNGGTCRMQISLAAGSHQPVLCVCQPGFDGERCELRQHSPHTYPSAQRTGDGGDAVQVGVAISAVVFVALILILGIYLYNRFKKAEKDEVDTERIYERKNRTRGSSDAPAMEFEFQGRMQPGGASEEVASGDRQDEYDKALGHRSASQATSGSGSSGFVNAGVTGDDVTLDMRPLASSGNRAAGAQGGRNSGEGEIRGQRPAKLRRSGCSDVRDITPSPPAEQKPSYTTSC